MENPQFILFLANIGLPQEFNEVADLFPKSNKMQSFDFCCETYTNYILAVNGIKNLAPMYSFVILLDVIKENAIVYKGKDFFQIEKAYFPAFFATYCIMEKKDLKYPKTVQDFTMAHGYSLSSTAIC